ncbi:hypothetical protein [Agromyces bauzanensis]
MTTDPTIEAAAVTGGPTRATEGPTPPRVRIRWGWFLGCIVLGLAAIIVGWFLVSPANRLGYVAGVLAGIGTTLLLVGIVVLLERRIVGTAVKVIQDATKQARMRTEAEMHALVRDFDDRVAEVWETAPSEQAAEETRRMTDQFRKRVADVYAGDEAETPKPR